MAQFEIAHPSFTDILGETPEARILVESKDNEPLYHEACVYDSRTKSIFVTSNQTPTSDTKHSSTGKQVKLSQIFIPSDNNTTTSSTTLAKVNDITPDSLASSFLNGGVNYDNDSILLCAQGSIDPQHPSGLIRMTISPPHNTTAILPSFHSIPFNSVNDVVIHPSDKSIWFTDPCYGYHQGIRPPPQLPNQVYRFDTTTQSTRAVADGFTRPNGLCFSPDTSTLYITDTGAIHGSNDIPIDPAGPSHIYAFDVRTISGEMCLVNRRLFAYAPGRFPDGIKCDMEGNVYAGCGNGITVWNQGGVLLGNIGIEGGVANFCFGEKGVLYACNESRFWEVKLNGDRVRGALLGL